MGTYHNLKAKMVAFEEILKRHRDMLVHESDEERPSTSTSTSSSTAGPSTRQSRISSVHSHSRIMAEHQEMMRQLALDIPNFPFQLKPDDIKFYELRRKASSERLKKRLAENVPNVNEIITEAESIRRTKQNMHFVKERLLESVLDILDLVEVINKKFIEATPPGLRARDQPYMNESPRLAEEPLNAEPIVKQRKRSKSSS